MRAAPIPRRARQAAVQPVTSAPSSGVILARGNRSRGLALRENRYYADYQSWQFPARHAARTVGVARMAANMVAQTASRVLLHVEEQDPRGDWAETEKPELAREMDGYRNETLGQGSSELVRLHTWQYQVPGEGAIVNRDNAYGQAEWLVVGLPAIEWNQPRPGFATVKLHPTGRIMEGLAFEVPLEQVVHFWMPDEDFLGLAVSPMTAAMNDLDRYVAFTRYAGRQAHNYLAMNGAFWTPGAAHVSENASDEDVTDGDREKKSDLLRQYEEMAAVSISDFDDEMLESVVPPMMWWDGAKPEWVEIGRPLDEQGIAHRAEAMMDFARDVDAPAALITSGGSSDENHWNAWMTKERFLGAVAPTLDRVTHQDLTVTYLHPLLRLRGVSEAELGRYRVGYDANPVIKQPDESEKALRAWMAGLLGAKPALEKMGFDPDTLAGPDDLERLAAILSNFAGEIPTADAPDVNTPDGPAGPGNVSEGPPPGPPTPANMLRGLLPHLYDRRQRAAPIRTNGTATARAAASSTLLAEALNPTDTGVMVSIDVPLELAQMVALPDGEPPEGLHLTLAFVLGEAAELPQALHDALITAAQEAAAETGPIHVSLSHVERFAPNEEGMQPVTLVDSGPAVPELASRLRVALDAASIPYSDDHGFRAHMTLGYYPEGEGPESGPLETPVEFDASGIGVHWGPEVLAVPFGGSKAATASVRVEHAPEQPSVAATAAVSTVGSQARREVTAARRTLSRLARVRRDVARQLLGGAEAAFAAALNQAGVRARTKAANKHGRGLAASVRAAFEQGEGLRPFFGTLGITEAELLRGAFDEFQGQAAAWLAYAREEQRQVAQDAGYDPSALGAASEDDETSAAAAMFLAASLLALARGRILAGTDAANPNGPGEVSGAVPASIVGATLAVAEGSALGALGESPDLLPELRPTRRIPLDASIRSQLSVRLDVILSTAKPAGTREAGRLAKVSDRLVQAPTEYVWVHGFYASPKTTFDPHLRLEGHRTNNPETDPAYVNPGPWPDPGTWPFFQPADHLGCTCAQIAQVDSTLSTLIDALA